VVRARTGTGPVASPRGGVDRWGVGALPSACCGVMLLLVPLLVHWHRPGHPWPASRAAATPGHRPSAGAQLRRVGGRQGRSPPGFLPLCNHALTQRPHPPALCDSVVMVVSADGATLSGEAQRARLWPAVVAKDAFEGELPVPDHPADRGVTESRRGRGWDGQHRAPRVREAISADPAGEHAGQGAMVTSSHHQQVSRTPASETRTGPGSPRFTAGSMDRSGGSCPGSTTRLRSSR
jgi:hypothetical protein